MSLTYAIADIHGRRDLLDRALKKIEKHGGGGTVVFTGDYVDRGPDSCGVIQRLIDGPAKPKAWNWVCLQGNHEAIQLEWARGKWDDDLYRHNGGLETLRSYGASDTTNRKKWQDHPHWKWMKKRPLWHVDAHRIFVHAYVEPDQRLKHQDPYQVKWGRWVADTDVPWTGAKDGEPRHIVHGHDKHTDGPLLYQHRTNLDVGACTTGRLLIAVFDDDKAGGPIDIMTVQGRAYDVRRAAYRDAA